MCVASLQNRPCVEMSKNWGLRWCAYEISIPGVDLEEMSRVKEVTGVETRRHAAKRDEVAENIECALYTTWLWTC
jgi:hypothetical protein